MSKHKHRSKHKEPKMATLEQLEALYIAQEPPITTNLKPDSNPSPDWKYYQKIKEYLPEWWEEFNGKLDHDGRLKYTTIREFIKHKVSKHQEQKLLYQMIGPCSKRDEDCKVPYLGDWDKRRRNGFGVLDNPEKIRPLIRVIQNNIAAAESIKSLTPVLVEELVQYTTLQKQVHEAFAGRSFLTSKAADDKKNISRHKSYTTMLWALTELKLKIIHEIMRVHGVDPNVPQQMRDMAQIAGGIGAAAALTGIAASQSGRLGGIGGVASADGTVIAPYTYDAIKLAEHLTRHAHTFKKPGPWEKVIDAETGKPVDDEEEPPKKNGHARPQ
jgi:hypothetical protein